jgi:hypothetical protein
MILPVPPGGGGRHAGPGRGPASPGLPVGAGGGSRNGDGSRNGEATRFHPSAQSAAVARPGRATAPEPHPGTVGSAAGPRGPRAPGPTGGRRDPGVFSRAGPRRLKRRPARRRPSRRNGGVPLTSCRESDLGKFGRGSVRRFASTPPCPDSSGPESSPGLAADGPEPDPDDRAVATGFATDRGPPVELPRGHSFRSRDPIPSP